jgi:hypothetical protein
MIFSLITHSFAHLNKTQLSKTIASLHLSFADQSMCSINNQSALHLGGIQSLYIQKAFASTSFEISSKERFQGGLLITISNFLSKYFGFTKVFHNAI